MAVWPPTLQQNASVEGYDETYMDSALRASSSIGRKTRLRDAWAMKGYSASILLESESIDTLWEFWRGTLRNGADPFDWVLFDDGETTASYLLLSDPEITAVDAALWRASLRLCDAAPRSITIAGSPSVVAWPTDLPAYAQVNGRKDSWSGFSLRSGISQGQATRARTTFTQRGLSLTQQMTLAQKRAFETFYETTAGLGTKPFTHDGFSTDGATETYRFAKPPKVTGLGARVFNVSMELIA